MQNRSTHTHSLSLSATLAFLKFFHFSAKQMQQTHTLPIALSLSLSTLHFSNTPQQQKKTSRVRTSCREHMSQWYSPLFLKKTNNKKTEKQLEKKNECTHPTSRKIKIKMAKKYNLYSARAQLGTDCTWFYPTVVASIRY